ASIFRHQAAPSSGPSLVSILPPGNTKSPAANLLAVCRRISRTSNAPAERLRRRTSVAAGTGGAGEGLTDTGGGDTVARLLPCTSWRTDHDERRSTTQGKEHRAPEADQPDGELRRRGAHRESALRVGPRTGPRWQGDVAGQGRQGSHGRAGLSGRAR